MSNNDKQDNAWGIAPELPELPDLPELPEPSTHYNRMLHCFLMGRKHSESISMVMVVATVLFVCAWCVLTIFVSWG